MKTTKLLSTFLILAAWNVQAAETVVTRIHDVIEPETAGENIRVLSTSDGRVYEVSPVNSALASEIRLAQQTGTALTLVVEEDAIVQATTATDKDISTLGEMPEELKSGVWPVDPLNASYVPTQFQTEQEVVNIFEDLEPIRSKSQCYQRAMLWSHAMWRERGVKSLKVFLFFTRRYIREYNYKWWFHVTPYVLMADGTERTLDYTFTNNPLTMKDWTDEFMHNHATCPVIQNYSQYENNQEAEHCYLRKVPMYYYQPLDIEQADTSGVPVTTWQDWTLGHAARARCRFFCF
jgi:hypothetical protein